MNGVEKPSSNKKKSLLSINISEAANGWTGNCYRGENYNNNQMVFRDKDELLKWVEKEIKK